MVDDFNNKGVKISKQDVNGKELSGAQLQIVDKDSKVVASWTSDGTVHTVNVTPGTYTLKETATPSNQYVKASDITFTVDENGKVTVDEKSVDQVTMVDEYAKTSIVITKKWDDNNNRAGKRPSTIVVNLFADGVKYDSKRISNDDGWKCTFNNLPKYKDGKEIKYTVTEDSVENYTASVDGYTITNKYTPKTVQVSGSKTWNDNNNAAGLRPSQITIRLYQNGNEIRHADVKSSNWSWNFTDLPKYDADGKEYNYTISEDAVSGYTTSVSGYNVANTIVLAYGSVVLTKTDSSNGAALAGATFDLYRSNGSKIGTYTTNVGGVLKVDGLAVGDYYFVETVAPTGYELNSAHVNFTITASTTATAPVNLNVKNTKKQEETIGVNAVKVWDDKDNKDGVRPSSVTFHLFADGVEIGSGQANAGNNWTVSFGNLPKTKNGVNISYAVTEDAVGNRYETSVATGLAADGSYLFTVTNYRETDEDYEARTGSVLGANRNKPSSGDVEGTGRGGVAGAGRGRGTGDDSNMVVYGGISGASVLALIAYVIATRKKRRNK